MLEQIFTNPSSGPATARGAIYAPAPARQKSPLEAFLANQSFGRQQAGNVAPTYSHLGAAGAVSSPGFNPARGATPSLDPAAIQGFYSDPANADYHADPALLGIRAADNTTRGNADVEALRGRRSIIAQLGDTGLASKVLAADDPTLGAVSADPDKSTSVLARLARGYRDTTNQNEDALNKANLFYSSERGRVLNSGAQDYSTEQADAIAQAQAQLDSISNSLASAKSGADQSDQQAENDAFNRYMAAIAAHPPTAAPGGAPSAPAASGTAPSGGDGSSVPVTPDVLSALIGGLNTGLAGPVSGPDTYDVMPYTDNNTGTGGAAAGAAAGLQSGLSAGGSYPVMDFTGPGTLDPLAEFLQPKKPLSGYSELSGAHLH